MSKRSFIIIVFTLMIAANAVSQTKPATQNQAGTSAILTIDEAAKRILGKWISKKSDGGIEAMLWFYSKNKVLIRQEGVETKVLRYRILAIKDFIIIEFYGADYDDSTKTRFDFLSENEIVFDMIGSDNLDSVSIEECEIFYREK